jgi:hypothetical protein
MESTHPDVDCHNSASCAVLERNVALVAYSPDVLSLAIAMQ